MCICESLFLFSLLVFRAQVIELLRSGWAVSELLPELTAVVRSNTEGGLRADTAGALPPDTEGASRVDTVGGLGSDTVGGWGLVSEGAWAPIPSGGRGANTGGVELGGLGEVGGVLRRRGSSAYRQVPGAEEASTGTQGGEEHEEANSELGAAWPLQDIVSLRGFIAQYYSLQTPPLYCAIYCTILPFIAPPRPVLRNF